MSRLERKETLESLQSLLNMIEKGEVNVHAHHEDALKRTIEMWATEKEPMAAYFALEAWLYEQKEKPIEIKSAMLWGGLWVVKKMGCIDWDTMRLLYGEYMSKKMDLR